MRHVFLLPDNPLKPQPQEPTHCQHHAGQWEKEALVLTKCWSLAPNGEQSQLCDPMQAPVVNSDPLQVIQTLFHYNTLANRIGET